MKDFGSWYHLVVGAFTLIVCLVSREVLKGVYKNLNVLVGLVFGYALAIIFTVAGIAPMVDFSGIHKTIQEVGVFSIPKLVFLTSHKPVFNLGAFLRSQSYFWYRQQRRQVQRRQSVREHLT